MLRYGSMIKNLYYWRGPIHGLKPYRAPMRSVKKNN